jgi:hypothetical protein
MNAAWAFWISASSFCAISARSRVFNLLGLLMRGNQRLLRVQLGLQIDACLVEAGALREVPNLFVVNTGCPRVSRLRRGLGDRLRQQVGQRHAEHLRFGVGVGEVAPQFFQCRLPSLRALGGGGLQLRVQLDDLVVEPLQGTFGDFRCGLADLLEAVHVHLRRLGRHVQSRELTTEAFGDLRDGLAHLVAVANLSALLLCEFRDFRLGLRELHTHRLRRRGES